MNGASTVLLFVRVGFSLAIVLGLIWIAARVTKRRGKIAPRQSETAIDVVARRQVGRRGSLVVVESAGRRFLVGVTDNHIDLVADLSSGDRAVPVDVTSLPAAARPLVLGQGATVVASPVDPVDPVELPIRSGEVVDRPPTVLGAEDPTTPRRDSLVDTLRDLTVRR